MKITWFPTVCVALLLGFFSTWLLAQNTNPNTDFLLDVSHPFVYVEFDHIGPGAKRNEKEPVLRIWVRLKNNCRIPVRVRANGVPDGSPKGEVGLEYDVVPEPDTLVIGTPEEVNAESKTRKLEKAKIPQGYMAEVASSVTLDPGEKILFSMPVNHLSKWWHVEIPFSFELPKGNGPRDPKSGGLPVMAIHYSLWDLPPQSQVEILKQ